MILTDRDPITTYAARPSHPVRPSWLLDAQGHMERAWQAHAETAELFLAGKASVQEMEQALDQAIAQQAYYLDACEAWQAGNVPASVALVESARQVVAEAR